MSGRRRFLRVAVVVCALSGPAAATSAQQPPPYHFDPGTEAAVLGFNAVLGGVTAGAGALIRGERLAPAVARGILGGALIYAGKGIAVEPWPAAGLVGRQVASIGGSIVANAAAGRGTLDRLALAAGPLRIYVGRAVPAVTARVDVPAAGVMAWALLEGDNIDIPRTLSAGAIVMRSDREMALPGTVFYSRAASADRQAYVRAHERVHVLQYDQSFLMWGDPIEAAAARGIPRLRPVFDHYEFNLPVLSAALLAAVLVWPEHDQQPWEREAVYLARTR